MTIQHTTGNHATPGRRAPWPGGDRSASQTMTAGPPHWWTEWCLSGRLQRLYQTIRNPATGAPYTLRGTVKAIRARYGPQYAPSTSFLSDLVAGRRENPSAKTLWALAQFFGVPMEYFTGQSTAAVIDQLLRQTLEHPVVREVAMHVAALPDASQHAVLSLVQELAPAAPAAPAAGAEGGAPGDRAYVR